VGFLVGVSVIPFLWCSRQAAEWHNLPKERAKALAATVTDFVERPMSRETFTTGSAQFDGEWLFGTYMMAGMGYGQLASTYPECREECLAAMRACIEHLLSDKVRAFDRESWNEDAIESLDGNNSHAAYLGYFNLVLSYHRLHAPNSEYADLNDRITDALVRRLGRSRTLLLETYPYECYPVDNCAVIASVALHAKATGTDRTELLEAWAATFRKRYMDPETGLMIQAVREYPAGIGGPDARGDIDSGPLVFGYGLSATGFALAGSRIHRDREMFTRLYATAHAWGAPSMQDDKVSFVTGGPLGNAILFAMLTAIPADVPPTPPGGEVMP